MVVHLHSLKLRHRLWTLSIFAFAAACALQAISSVNAYASPLEITYTKFDPPSTGGVVRVPAPVVYGPGGDYGFGAWADGRDGAGTPYAVYVQDTRRDGYRVGLHWRVVGGERKGLCVNKRGSSAGVKACMVGIAGSKTLEIRLGFCDGGSDEACDQLAEYEFGTSKQLEVPL